MTNHPIFRKKHGKQFFLFLLLLVVAVLAASWSTITLAAAPDQQESAPPALQSGDAERGRQLFMGNVHLQNDGPPCMGCHTIGDNGLLGGGALGPDLTDVTSRYDHAGLVQALAAIPMPVMQPIFSEHPLTPQEQADLIAFLEASAGGPGTDREALVFGLSFAGLVAAAGLFGILYRRRLRGVRKPLVRAETKARRHM